jgi:hypothetical protein
MTPIRLNVALGTALLSLTVLGACMTDNTIRTSTAPQIIPQTHPYIAGTGTVQSLTRMPEPLSAAAGGSAAPATMHRLGVRMDDGRFQYVDVDTTEFTVGSRIQLGPDMLIRRN